MPPLKVYPMDSVGVVVDTDPLERPFGAFTKAQNAIPDPIGEDGSVGKRPGLAKFNSTAGTGTVKGAVGVPIYLGSAGPNFQNPFTDVTTTIAQFTTPVYTSTTVPLGATFEDNSWEFSFDWNIDFPEFSWEDIISFDLDTLGNFDISQREGIEAFQDIDAFNRFDPPSSLYDLTDGVLQTGASSSSTTSSGYTSGTSTAIPATYVGDVTGFWYLTLDAAAAQDVDNNTTYSNTKTLIFPTGSVRAYNASGSGTGGMNDANYPLASWFSPDPTSKEDGYPTAVLNGVLYYAGGYDDYTVGTTAPVLRAFDGIHDQVVARVPKNASNAHAKAIVSLLAANNTIYFSTLDSGTTGAAGGTIVGSVYKFDATTRTISRLGAVFPTGHLPYSLAYAYGRLWCGTAINQLSDTTPARVYWIRPDIDTAWTLDKTFAANEEKVLALAVFKGLLYAAILWNVASAGTATVYVRSLAGVWSASDTGTLAGLGGYTALIVWPDENSAITSPTPALYAIRWGITGEGQLASDTFDRANETPLAGSWTAVTAGTFKLDTKAVAPSVLGTDAAARYTGVSFPTSQYASADLTVTGSTSGTGPGLALNCSAAAETYYRCVVNGTDMKMSRVNAGVVTSLGTVAVTWVGGDTLEFRAVVQGSNVVLTAYQEDVLKLTVTDTSPISGGTPGIAYVATSTAATINNWVAGDAESARVRKFNGSSWSEVASVDYTRAGITTLAATYSLTSSTAKPTLWAPGGAGQLKNTTDGTTWTDRWASITSGAQTVGATASFVGTFVQF